MFVRCKCLLLVRGSAHSGTSTECVCVCVLCNMASRRRDTTISDYLRRACVPLAAAMLSTKRTAECTDDENVVWSGCNRSLVFFRDCVYATVVYRINRLAGYAPVCWQRWGWCFYCDWMCEAGVLIEQYCLHIFVKTVYIVARWNLKIVAVITDKCISASSIINMPLQETNRYI